MIPWGAHVFQCVGCGRLYGDDEVYYDPDTEEPYCRSCWESVEAEREL